MLALVKKDLYVLKKTYLLFAGIMLFYVVIGVCNGNDFSIFQIFSVMVTMMLPVTSMSVDEKCRWDIYGMSLPVSRKMVVASKYVLTLVGMLASTLLGILMMAVGALLNGTPASFQLIFQPVFIACGGVILADIGMPLMFKLGTEKGRYAMVAVIWAVALGPMILKKLLNVNVYDLAERALNALNSGSLSLTAAAAVAVTAVSVLLSMAFYERKELH